jgi:hypothetical protein
MVRSASDPTVIAPFLGHRLQVLAGPSDVAWTSCSSVSRPVPTVWVRKRRRLVSTPGNPEATDQMSAPTFFSRACGA